MERWLNGEVGEWRGWARGQAVAAGGDVSVGGRAVGPSHYALMGLDCRVV